MLTKTRTTLITLIAACSFATATIAPAVPAEPPAGSGSATGCGGVSKVGDEITVTVTVKRGGQSVSKPLHRKVRKRREMAHRRIAGVARRHRAADCRRSSSDVSRVVPQSRSLVGVERSPVGFVETEPAGSLVGHVRQSR